MNIICHIKMMTFVKERLPYGDTQTGEFIRLLSVLKRSKLKRQSDVNKACTWCSRHTGHVAISVTISLIPGHGSLTPEKR
jgi:hypothetical protein